MSVKIAQENQNDKVLSHSQAVRISVEQRTVMLDYMIKNPALATGRFNGPQGAKCKQKLLKELAATLNSLPNGVSKSAEKWMKSWQDWRSDVKSKASKLKKEKKTGGGKCLLKPLTPLEEQLLSFLRPCLVSGHEEVLDPLAISTQDPPVQDQRDEAIYREPIEYLVDTELHDEFVFIPLEENTISAPDLSPHVASPPLVLSEGSVPPSSEFNSPGFPCSSSKKRKRHVGDACTDDNDLVELYKQQLACMHEQNNIRRAQLQLNERKTIAIESAAVALTGAMKALEEFLKHKRNSED